MENESALMSYFVELENDIFRSNFEKQGVPQLKSKRMIIEIMAWQTLMSNFTEKDYSSKVQYDMEHHVEPSLPRNDLNSNYSPNFRSRGLSDFQNLRQQQSSDELCSDGDI